MGDTNSNQPKLNDQLHRLVVDFDAWADLARADPDSFERKREDLLEEFFKQIPQKRQQRLRGLQFRIDMERRKARSAMGACIKITAMMWDSVEGKNGLLDSIRKLTHGVQSDDRIPEFQADILPFRRQLDR